MNKQKVKIGGNIGIENSSNYLISKQNTSPPQKKSIQYRKFTLPNVMALNEVIIAHF